MHQRKISFFLAIFISSIFLFPRFQTEAFNRNNHSQKQVPTIIIPTRSPRFTKAKPYIIIPTSLPSPTPTKVIISPTTMPSVDPTIAPTSAPLSTPTSVLQTDKTSYFLNKINEYRSSQGLSAVQTNNETCDFASTRAQEITSSFNHDGFSQRIDNHTLPYQSYTKITENIAMNSNYQDVIPQWINSPGHAENMRADTPYVCVESNGDYYAYEGWKP